MRIDIVTLFPDMVESGLAHSIVGRARKAGRLEMGFVDPRAFAKDRHKTVDDRPFGGGPGMVMMAEPLYQAVRKVKKRGTKVALMSPQGRRLDQKLVAELSKEKHLVLVCGHYEGIDERFVEKSVDFEVSLGDFVLTGGEIAAMAVVDAVARLLPGVLGDADSPKEESFSEAGLEYPHYTRPREWRGLEVPEVLVSGDHRKIGLWRAEQALERTRRKRPDLLKQGERK